MGIEGVNALKAEKSIPSGISLERFLCFSSVLGIDVLFQGEDISGLLVTSSGSKIRMLGFRLASILRSNADIIVSGFAARSNHVCRVAAAHKLGLNVRLNLRHNGGSAVR